MTEEVQEALTVELIHELEMHSFTRAEGWTHKNTDSSYDDGYEYHTIVWQENATGNYYAFDHRTNSWDTEGLYEQDLNIRRVYPKDVVVTQYFDEP